MNILTLNLAFSVGLLGDGETLCPAEAQRL
jgi:hypothetical protein